MSKIDELARELAGSNKHQTSAYDTTAKVLRVENGIAWVHIPGGVPETPVKLTISAQKGDNVQVRVGGGTAWLVGNVSAPPTDDKAANEAKAEVRTVNKKVTIIQGTAQEAKEVSEEALLYSEIAQNAADAAIEDAAAAHQAADEAVEDAAIAHQAADEAKEDAADAKNSAIRANTSANDALGQLSVVEKVVDTLNWVTEHGRYDLTTDTAVDPDKTYFVFRDGVYTPVAEPIAEDLGTYYELTIDEAVTNYVATHLAVTDAGLWVTLDDHGYKVLIANDGVYIYDYAGHIVTTLGESIRFDSERPQMIGGDEAFILYYDADGDGKPDSIMINGASITTTSGHNINEFINESWRNITFDIEEDYGTTQTTYYAKVYRYGEEIQDEFPPYLFEWFKKNEGGYISIGTGRSKTFQNSDIEYGGVIKCRFSPGEPYPLNLPGDDDGIIFPNGDRLTMNYFK